MRVGGGASQLIQLQVGLPAGGHISPGSGSSPDRSRNAVLMVLFCFCYCLLVCFTVLLVDLVVYILARRGR